jgi:hypothetical protein
MSDIGDVRDTGEIRDTSDTPDMTRNERRAADRRQMTREPLRDNPEVREREEMRTNPEVMGRAEPVAVEDRDLPAPDPRPGRVGGPGEQRAANDSMWPDTTEFHRRFEQIQSDFIEEPREAVKKAERLVQEMLDHVMGSMRERMKAMHGEVEGKSDTEQLRMTMQRYRDFIRSFGKRETV